MDSKKPHVPIDLQTIKLIAIIQQSIKHQCRNIIAQQQNCYIKIMFIYDSLLQKGSKVSIKDFWEGFK